MAFSLPRKNPDLVPNPSSVDGKVYVSDTGELTVRQSDGTEKKAQLPDGSPIFLANQSTDPAALANKYRVFSKIASGAANLHVRAPDGTVIQLTGGGGLVGTGGGLFFDPVVAQVEETFSIPNLVGVNSIEWDTDLHFVLPDADWSLVPVWVEMFVSGPGNLQQATTGALYVYLFSPGPGTPQSRVYAPAPGYQDGQIAQRFYSYYGASLESYYNSIVNGDEVRVTVGTAGFPDTTTQIHATAIMGGALAVFDPNGPF